MSDNITLTTDNQLLSLWDDFNVFNPSLINNTKHKDNNKKSKASKNVAKSKLISNNFDSTTPSENTVRKKRKLNNGSDIVVDDNQNESKQINEFVSATGVKNYLLQDPILDYFEERGKKRKYSEFDEQVNQINQDNQNNQMNIQLDNKLENKNTNKKSPLFDKGLEFENKINNYLKQKFGINFIEINTQGKFGCTRENFNKTIDAMMNGYPIISQGVVFNDFNKTFGTFDLIIRSDYINTIITRPVLDDDLTTLKAPKLNGNYHYIVIDIKWTTMTLCANGYTIRNEGRFPSYKGQLAIYNCAMGNIQGYIPSKAYIMAKAWKIDKKNDYREGYNSFDLLGEIDYSDFDYKYINNTIDALGWIRDVRRYGDSWDLYNPTISEMYPNCSNKLDSPWTKEKQKVADKIGELTNVWYVNIKHRQNSHANGVMSWKDPKCNSQIMGLSKGDRGRIIDEILNINRHETDMIRPMNIKNNTSYWQIPGPTDFFIDFETINCCFNNPQFDIKNSKTESDMVFMIGIGHEENNEFVYKVFYTNDLSFQEEEKMFDNFARYIVEKIKQLDPQLEYVPRLFHWGFAEQSNVNHVNRRHLNKYIKLFEYCQWVDMYNIFTNEPIVIRGALDFKLKHIGKAMHKHGLVNTLWDDNGPSDGLGAMLGAVECYASGKINSPEFQLIIDYNKIDCKILWEILCYLRKNHCNNAQ